VIEYRICLRIISDCWKGYNTTELEQVGFTHLKVNHKINFVDPETGAYTQKVRENVEFRKVEQLVEYMWRAAVKTEGRVHCNAILEDISAFRVCFI
jgi:hypothetical protein